MSNLNKTKIENILKKSNNNIVQYEDNKYYISDEYCIWIDHDGEFFEEDRYLYKKTEVPEKDRKNVKELADKVIHDCLDKCDYWKAETVEKCKVNSKKCVMLKNEDWNKVIKEKYYETFKKGCKFLISKNSWVVFVTDEEGLLIGIIASMFVDDSNIEM